MQTYLSLDPGITTGYTIGIHEDNKLYLAVGQDKLTHKMLYNLLLEVYPDHTVCEDFEFRQKARDNLELFSVQLIGVVHLWSQSYLPERPIYIQKAAEGKGYYTDNLLKGQGVYKKGVPHGMDSLRHLLHWFTYKAGFQFNNNPELIPISIEQWKFPAKER